MRHDTRAAFIERHVFGDVDAVIAWAVERLDSGVDNDDLAVLAGLSAHENAEVDAYFARALVALGEGSDELAVEVRRYAARIGWSIPVDVSPNVQPATSLEITIAFRPTIAGEVTGALRIETNASNGTGTDVIQLRGTGIAP